MFLVSSTSVRWKSDLGGRWFPYLGAALPSFPRLSIIPATITQMLLLLHFQSVYWRDATMLYSPSSSYMYRRNNNKWTFLPRALEVVYCNGGNVKLGGTRGMSNSQKHSLVLLQFR